jgi:hypothetical protein
MVDEHKPRVHLVRDVTVDHVALPAGMSAWLREPS